MDKYLLCLYKQYYEAKGLNSENLELDLSYGFIEWIANNKLLLKEYADYLTYIGFHYSSEDTIEVGKGRYDSIANRDTNVVSEFGPTLKRIQSQLIVHNGTPYVIAERDLLIPQQHIILTHNPYFNGEILKWASIHNLGEHNISVGMFGVVTDENAKEKIKVLEQLSKSMSDDFSFDFDTDKDKYFCSINSKRNIKTKIKVLTR